MPKWLSRRPQPPEKPMPPVQPPVAKTPPVKSTPASASPTTGPARRAADLPLEPRTADLALDDASAVQARLRQDLNELLKAHRQQGRVLERNQKLLEQTEQELSRQRGRASALETEVAEQRTASGEQVDGSTTWSRSSTSNRRCRRPMRRSIVSDRTSAFA